MGFLNWLLQDDDTIAQKNVVNPPPDALDESVLDRYSATQLGRAIHRQTVARGVSKAGRPKGSKNRPKGEQTLLPGEKPDRVPPAAAAAVLALLLAIGMAGCSTGQTSGVPATKINLGHGVTAEFPKNVTVSNLTVQASNGVPTYVHADWIQSVNDPSVLEQAGRADSYRIDSIFNGAGVVAGEAVAAAIGKGPVKLPAPVPGK